MGWGDKFNQLTKTAVSKSKEVAEITRLNMEISSSEQKMKELAAQIGMIVAGQSLLSDHEEIAGLAGPPGGRGAEPEPDPGDPEHQHLRPVRRGGVPDQQVLRQVRQPHGPLRPGERGRSPGVPRLRGAAGAGRAVLHQLRR